MHLASGNSAASPAPPPRPPSPPAWPPADRSFPKPTRLQPAQPQHHRSASEQSSKRRLKPVWTSMHFPHLPLSQRASSAFRAVLHCSGDRSSIPRSSHQHEGEQSSCNSISNSTPLLTTKLNCFSMPLSHTNTWLICTYPCSAPSSDQQHAAGQETSPETPSLITEL